MPQHPFFSEDDVEDRAALAAFEERVAALVEVGVGVAVHSGAAARFLALAAAGIGPGDEVLVPDLGGLSTAHAVTLTGATPVLVDADEHTLGMDPAAAEARVTPRTRALVVAHLGGRAAAIDHLRALAHRFDLTLVEDAGEAVGSRASSVPLGAHGHAGVVAFSRDHLIGLAGGGVVVTRSSRAALALRDRAEEHELAMPGIVARAGLAALAALPARLAHRRWLRSRYRDGLAGLPRVHLAPYADEELPLWIDVRVDGRRAGLVDAIAAAGHATRPLPAPAHQARRFRDDDARFPAATRLAAQTLYLPSSPQLDDEDVARIVDAVARWSGT